MALLYYPDPVFRQKAEIVTHFDDTLEHDLETMFKVFHTHEAIGLGANMCGILKRIIIAPLSESNIIPMINPEITHKSEDTQTHLEASLSLPGISAKITRPKTITVTYQDPEQNQHEVTVSDFAATVIQHEVDYLDGIIYLDYLSKTKSQMLLDKMRRYMKKISRNDNKKCGCC